MITIQARQQNSLSKMNAVGDYAAFIKRPASIDQIWQAPKNISAIVALRALIQVKAVDPDIIFVEAP